MYGARVVMVAFCQESFPEWFNMVVGVLLDGGVKDLSVVIFVRRTVVLDVEDDVVLWIPAVVVVLSNE